MNNGDINNNVVPNATTNVTNNTNTGAVQPTVTPPVANTVVQNAQPVLQPQAAISNTQPVVEPQAVASSEQPVLNTNVAPAAVVSEPTTSPSPDTSTVASNVLPNSQPVLNPSTDVDFSKVVNNGANSSTEDDNGELNKKQKHNVRSSSPTLVTILFIIIVGLIFYVVYSSGLYKTNLEHLKYNCTPVNSYKEDKQLDVNSTIVVELYNKVRTSIREDYAQPDFNDNMKLYLAWRQIPQNKYYGSNCNLFKNTTMEPYKCDDKKFTPQAFKEEDLIHEIKMLFGEETNIPLGNIKLQNNCIGGYAYIKERGEFVEGKCDLVQANSYSVDKVLKEAYTNRNTITLVEEVKYKENEKLKLPDYLKSGLYYYTFRLDMNFNYVLVNRTYESKY